MIPSSQLRSASTKDYYHQISAQILLSDVALGLTFATMALTKSDKAEFTRLVGLAWRAHDSILLLRRSIDMSREDERLLTAGLDQLGMILRDLAPRSSQT